jgi:hypothetical protein
MPGQQREATELYVDERALGAHDVFDVERFFTRQGAALRLGGVILHGRAHCTNHQRQRLLCAVNHAHAPDQFVTAKHTIQSRTVIM